MTDLQTATIIGGLVTVGVTLSRLLEYIVTKRLNGDSNETAPVSLKRLKERIDERLDAQLERIEELERFSAQRGFRRG